MIFYGIETASDSVPLGLITNAEDQLISMVRSLVETYVQGRNTLIVIAMPMTGASRPVSHPFS